MSEWLTSDQVAARLQVHTRTVHRWAREHAEDTAKRRKRPRGLKGYKLGRSYRFKSSDVEGVFK